MNSIELEEIIVRPLLRQALHFIGLSGLGWMLDFSLYTGLTSFSATPFISNMISSWAGVTFVFVSATRKIFQNKSTIPLKWKYLIYLLYQFILIFLMSKVLGKINMILINNIGNLFLIKISPIIAKVLITPITMVLNFIIMKGIIEKL